MTHLTVQRAINEGFGRAFTAILDSNLTTLLVGGILFAMGTGPVKGFAVTMSLGIFRPSCGSSPGIRTSRSVVAPKLWTMAS